MVNDDFIREKLEKRFAELFADLYDEKEVQAEEVETICLSDRNNSELEYEIMDYIELDDELYIVLLPNDSCGEEGLVRIMRFIDLGDDFDLVDVDDDYVLEPVYDIFRERFEDLLNFED